MTSHDSKTFINVEKFNVRVDATCDLERNFVVGIVEVSSKISERENFVFFWIAQRTQDHRLWSKQQNDSVFIVSQDSIIQKKKNDYYKIVQTDYDFKLRASITTADYRKAFFLRDTCKNKK